MSIEQTQNKTNIPLVATTAVVGGVVGVTYSATHLSEKNAKLMADAASFPKTFAKEMRDSFNLSAAKSHLSRGNITRDDFNALKTTHDGLSEVYEKQLAYHKNEKNPDVKIRRAALSEANKSVFNFRRIINNLSASQMDKFCNLGIVNKQKAKAVINEMKSNSQIVKNAFLRPVSLGLICGAFLGGAFGAALSPLLRKNN